MTAPSRDTTGSLHAVSCGHGHHHRTTYGHTLRDADGNLAVWYASGTSPWGSWDAKNGEFWAVGEARTVKATVKRHEVTRDGVQRTVLTRVVAA